jgi:hypothetical protein
MTGLPAPKHMTLHSQIYEAYRMAHYVPSGDVVLDPKNDMPWVMKHEKREYIQKPRQKKKGRHRLQPQEVQPMTLKARYQQARPLWKDEDSKGLKIVPFSERGL